MSIESSHARLAPQVLSQGSQENENAHDSKENSSERVLQPQSSFPEPLVQNANGLEKPGTRDEEGAELRSPSVAVVGIPSENQELHGIRLVLVTIPFMLFILLVALDQNIICEPWLFENYIQR